MSTKGARELDREIEDAIAGGSGAPGAPAAQEVGVPTLGQLLGRTSTGKIVEVPRRHGAPDTNNVVVFRRVKAKFPGWTKADHMEAADLLERASQAAAAAGERRLESTLSRWSSVHWDIGGRWTSPEIEAYLARLRSTT